MTEHPFDACYCGDYRHQHVDGKGRCKLGSLCTPSPCLRFRFVAGPSEADLKKPDPNRYMPQTEDEAAELMDNGRNTGGGAMRR